MLGRLCPEPLGENGGRQEVLTAGLILEMLGERQARIAMGLRGGGD